MENISGLYSQEETPNKQRDFRKIIRHHLNVVRHIRDKHSWAKKMPYLYIDAFAGPGRYCGIVGSPIIFLEEVVQSGIPFRAIAIEIDPDRAEQLRRYSEGLIEVVNGCNLDYLQQFQFHNNQFGLVYCDPPGAKDSTIPLSFRMMSHVAARANKVDVMVNIAPASHKRTIQLAGYQSIDDMKREINKRQWAIRDMRGKHQWTFLIGTNWVKWADWNSAGFYDCNSEAGGVLFDQANLTKDQFKKKVQPHLTGLMQSTSDIQRLELSGRKSLTGLKAFVSDAVKSALRRFTI